MRSRNLRIITALSFAVVAHAQGSDTTGAFRGRVNNAKGGAIAGATLQIRNVDTGATRSAQAGADGTFSMGLLQVGTYKVTVKAPGMKMVEDQIRVSLGEAASRTYRMDEEMAAATVEIIATAQNLDAAQVNTVSTIDEKLVQSIPLVSRNFMDLVRLTPGAVAGPGNPPRLMVGGARQIMNNLQIDGATNNSSFFGEQRGGAIIPFVFGADTIRELQVITNGFDVQYGNAAGATINAITKSGTNEFTGSVLHLVRNDSWMAKAKATPFTPAGSLQNTPAQLTRSGNSTNTNLTVGGPIVKDKLFYFVGIETYNTKLGAKPSWNTVGASPTDLSNFASSGFLDIFTRSGATLGQEVGNPSTGTVGAPYTQETKNTSYLARIDYNLNESHRFALRVNYNKFEDTIGGGNFIGTPPSNLLLNTTNAISWVLEANSIWTPELFSETRLQVSNERRPFAGNGISPAISLPSFSAGTKTSTPRQMNEIMTELIHNTTWTRGDWTLKGGFDLQSTSIGNQFFNNGNGSWNFGSSGTAYATAYRWMTGNIGGDPLAGYPFFATDAANISYSGATSVNGGRVDIDQKLNSAYAQGSYNGLLAKRLTLTAGLRFSQQKLSGNPLPNPNFKGLDSAADSSRIDPRFAFALDVDGKGKTVLRGGYGWFSTPTPLLLVANTMTGNGQNITNYSFRLFTTASDLQFITKRNNTLDAFNTGALSAAQLLSGQYLSRVSNTDLATTLAILGFSSSASSTQVWDPETKMSRAKKVHLALEHDLGDGLTVAAKVTFTRFEGLQYLQNINLNQGNIAAPGTPVMYNDGYANPSLNVFGTNNRPGQAMVRGRLLDFRGALSAPGNPTSGFGDVYLVKGDGYGRYRGLTFEVSKRWSEEAGLSGNVTFSKSEDTNSNERGTFTSTGGVLSELALASTSNPANPKSDFGPSYADRFMVFNLAGYFPIAFGVKGSFRLNFATGLPYTALAGNDTNGDGIRNNPFSGGRNGERQPDTKTMDMRVSREFKIFRTISVEGSVDVFNVFNWANQEVRDTEMQATNGTGLINPDFQKIAGRDFRTREVQFGVRVKF